MDSQTIDKIRQQAHNAPSPWQDHILTLLDVLDAQDRLIADYRSVEAARKAAGLPSIDPNYPGKIF